MRNQAFTPAPKHETCRELSYKHNFLMRGFTLIELLVTMAIIAILAGVVMVSMTAYRDRARETAALQTASSVMPAVMKCALEGKSITGSGSGQIPSAGSPICSGSSLTWPNLGTGSTSGWSWSWAYGESSDTNWYFYHLNDGSGNYILCPVTGNAWDNPTYNNTAPGTCNFWKS